MKNPFLIGPRIYLRALEVEDAEALIPLVTRPEVRNFLRMRRPMGLEEERAWLRNLPGQEGSVHFGIALREGPDADALVGSCGLRERDRVARCWDFGIAIGVPERWGQGLGREAIGLLLRYGFQELGAHRIELEVFSHNPRAIACYRALGFVEEGRRREAHFADGRHVDAIGMALLAAEWRALQQADA